MSDRDRLARVLARVEKPGRYVGGEWNEIRKDPARARTKVALAFPDVYEIGMSYLGQKILYALLNRDRDVLAERVFAPWPDFERELRAAGLPLVSLENGLPLSAFDIVGFSLLYELNFSNVLTILDLGGIPLTSAGRGEDAPLVIAGGPAAFNPEPVADLFDAVFVGDGEEGFPEIVRAVADMRRRGLPRRERLRELARIEGVYVPSLYRPVAAEGSSLVVPRPENGAPASVRKRQVKDFSRSAFPEKIVVPGLRVVFDRVAIEAARGCPQSCRFCQASTLYFPHRPKDPDGRPQNGPAKPPPDGLRGPVPLRALDRRSSPARGDRRLAHGRPQPREDLPLPVVAPAGAAVPRARGEHPQGPQDRLHPRAGGRDRAPPRRHQQEARRPRDPRRPDLRLRGRLAARQALLHGRAADRDGRGPGRHRRASSATASISAGRSGVRPRASTSACRRSSPSRTRRSNGWAWRTRPCSPKSTLA